MAASTPARLRLFGRPGPGGPVPAVHARGHASSALQAVAACDVRLPAELPAPAQQPGMIPAAILSGVPLCSVAQSGADWPDWVAQSAPSFSPARPLGEWTSLHCC